MIQTPFPTKCDPIQRAKPTIAAPISNGKAQRISFLTQESEVYVEAPVKLIARKAENAGMRRSQPIISRRPVPVIQLPQGKEKSARAVNNPMIAPLSEKALPGTQGKSRGVTHDRDVLQ